MAEDARFEDGGEAPLRLRALDGDDLAVLAALAQDAVFTAGDMSWLPRHRRFALLIRRFRWEDLPNAERRGRPPERVQSVLAIEDVLKVSSMGIDRGDPDLVLSLLDIAFEPGPETTGRVILTLAGDGAIALEVEALEVVLRDVTRPYVAPSRKAPSHPL